MTKEEAKKEFGELLEIQNELIDLREQESRFRENTEYDSEIKENKIERANEMQNQFVGRYKHYLEKYDDFKNKLADEDFAEFISYGQDDFTKTFGIVEEKETILLNETEQKVSRRHVSFPEL
jgi:hypothetical protein